MNQRETILLTFCAITAGYLFASYIDEAILKPSRDDLPIEFLLEKYGKIIVFGGNAEIFYDSSLIFKVKISEILEDCGKYRSNPYTPMNQLIHSERIIFYREFLCKHLFPTSGTFEN